MCECCSVLLQFERKTYRVKNKIFALFKTTMDWMSTRGDLNDRASERDIIIHWQQELEHDTWSYSIALSDDLFDLVPFKNCVIEACISETADGIFFRYCLFRESDVPATKVQPAVVELFNIRLISEHLRTNFNMTLKFFRTDRSLASLDLTTSIDSQDVSQSHLWVKLPNNHHILAYGKLALNDNEARESALSKLLKSAYKKLEQYKECSTCLMPHRSQTAFCEKCAAYECVNTREECIVCKQADHPTRFKCKTCIDANVCSVCAANKLWKKMCPMCKKPQSVFGGKRVRYEENDASDDD
jgi:hypothetical protein